MSVLGGPFNGYSPKQTILGNKDGQETMTRSILRRGWNTSYARGTYKGLNRAITPFRAVNNAGDFLARQNYSCGGPAPLNKNKPGYRIGTMFNNCDNTNVPASSCNVKYVYDSSDYMRFKKQMAFNKNYNDSKNGGDQSNASYTAIMHVKRY
jgi:hypothetical protein